MHGATRAAFQKRSHFSWLLKSNHRSKTFICKCFSFRIASKHLIPVRETCSTAIHSERKALERLWKAVRTAQDWAQRSLRGLNPARHSAARIPKVLFHLSAFFAWLQFSPPSSFPLLLSVAILGTPDPRQRYLGSLLFFPLRSRQTWSLLPRSPASHSCKPSPWKPIPEEVSWENYCGDKPSTVSSGRAWVILKASYETRFCPCALQGITATRRVRWLMLPSSC